LINRNHVSGKSFIAARWAISCFWLGCLSIILALSGCQFEIGGRGGKKKEGKATPAPVRIVQPMRGSIATYLHLDGAIEPERSVEVTAQTAGIVKALLVEEGDRVREGQLLVKLQDSEQTLAVERARATVERQHALLLRAEELFNRQMISAEEIEQMRLTLQDAEIALKQAELALDYTTIEAPFTGAIARRSVSIGDQVAPGRTIVTLVDRNILLLNCWVSESELANLHIGSTAMVSSQASITKSFEARLIRISPVMDPQYGKLKVTFQVIDPGGLLKPGQFVELRMTMEEHSDALLLPKKSVIYETGMPMVFVVLDTLAFRRPIQIGLETGDRLEVLTGITSTDSVVVEGQATIKDSARVAVVGVAGFAPSAER
jgi:RND family efflux transporter MFP subunit